MISFDNASIALTDSVRVSTAALWLVVCTFLVYLGLLAFLHMSRWGMRMRASGQNALLAAQRGINLHTVYALAWTLSTFSGSLAGILVTLDSRIDVNMAVIGLKAFPAALVGGLEGPHLIQDTQDGQNGPSNAPKKPRKAQDYLF